MSLSIYICMYVCVYINMSNGCYAVGVEVGTHSFFPIKYSQGMLKSIASDNLVLLLVFSCGLSLSPVDLFLLTRGGTSGE